MQILSLVLAFFSFVSLPADVLFLKSGEILEGMYVEGDGKGIQFETEKGRILYKKKDIAKLELGYSGSSFCFAFQGRELICEGILHTVSEDSISYVKGMARTKVETVPLKKIVYLKIYKAKRTERLLGVFAVGMEVLIHVEGKKESGIIEDYNYVDKQILFKINGTKRILEEDSILSLEWKKKPGILNFTKLAMTYTIPGVHQFKTQKATGIALGSLFLLFSAAIPIEFLSAQRAAASNVDYIPIGNTILLVSGLDSDPNFEQHKKNYYYAIGGMSVLYLIHSYTIYKEYTEGKIPSFQTLELSFSKGSREGRAFQNFEQMGMNTNIELKYSYSF
jgi:hypothetical protein